jgi:hypothetical protein
MSTRIFQPPFQPTQITLRKRTEEYSGREGGIIWHMCASLGAARDLGDVGCGEQRPNLPKTAANLPSGGLKVDISNINYQLLSKTVKNYRKTGSL